jgi:hypothetical protein
MKRVFFRMVRVVLLGVSFLPVLAQAAVHSADTSENGRISLSELLRVIQFYNSHSYCCDASSEDGYGVGDGDRTCAAHDSDYMAPDWSISLSELLRLIQFFNIGRYRVDAASEDGYKPCTSSELDPHLIPVIGDADGNFLTEAEEQALGAIVEPGDPPLGLELGLVTAAAIATLGRYYSEDSGIIVEGEAGIPPTDRPYLLILHEMDCGCRDPFTEEFIPFVDYELVDPVADIHIPLSEVALEFLSYGSFSYFRAGCENEDGNCYFDGAQVRLDVVSILAVLGLEAE